MQPQKKFFYSIYYALYPVVYIAFWGMLMYYDHRKLGRPFIDKNLFSPPWFGGFAIIFALIVIHHCVRYLLPMLFMKPLMELDNEKMNYRHRGKIIYWSDVKEVTYADLFNIAVIKLNNNKKVRVYLNCVRGSNEGIYETIVSYHKKAADIIV